MTPTIIEQARRIVTDPDAPVSLRRLAWLALKSATGKPARQRPGGREAGQGATTTKER